MRVPERNNKIAECAREMANSRAAFLQQMEMIAQKYTDIPNISASIRKALEGENKAERISECIAEFQAIHDTFFPRGSPLNDEQWEECIHKMDEVSAKYKKDIPNISGALCMAFLNDIEEYHKKWVEFKKNGKS